MPIADETFIKFTATMINNWIRRDTLDETLITTCEN